MGSKISGRHDYSRQTNRMVYHNTSPMTTTYNKKNINKTKNYDFKMDLLVHKKDACTLYTSIVMCVCGLNMTKWSFCLHFT
jgi:hypothetical protein